MKILLLTFLLLTTSSKSFTNSNILLNEKGVDLRLSKELKTQKTLRLDDAFLIQLYSSWKAQGALKHETNEWIQKIIDHKFPLALLDLNKVSEQKITKLKKASELYLLFKERHYQAFLGEWIKYSAESSFLSSELGLALDQVVGKQASNIFMSSGFSLTSEMNQQLEKIEDIPGKVNYSLQALKAMKEGDKAVKWIGKLDPDDELRVQLAYSAILAYAKKGKLGASGTLIKKIIEPWIEKSFDQEDISFYYLTLGRLLYQAKAYKESASYYGRIPESSKFFLEARTESLWSHLQSRDFSKSAGELGSLRLDVFSEQFYPEIFLASAIGHTMLCQFSDAKSSIHSFIKNNKKWGKRIDDALNSTKPSLIRKTPLTRRMRNQINSINKELKFFSKNKITNYNKKLTFRLAHVKGLLEQESRRQWVNRHKIFNSAFYKMKFVRIELLSRMKAVAEGLKPQSADEDEVKMYQAARLKGNQISFPNDRMPWGDELFSMSAEVINQCIQGKYYAQ